MKWRVDLALFLPTVALFLIWPDLDLYISDKLWTPQQGFFLRDQAWVRLTYDLFGYLPRLLAVFLLTGWLYTFLSERWQSRRPMLAFLLFSLILGPGLLVNEVLKGQYGRARPHQVEAFGGERTYTPPTRPARECERNCSFVSGHAAGAFWLMAAGWVAGKHRWLLPGLALGLFVGLVRMIQGGHFFSDVLFAGWAVWFTLRLSARYWLGRWSVRPDVPDA